MTTNSEPAKHPAIEAKCTKAQIEAFEGIATGQTRGWYPRTLDVLHRKGLIQFAERSLTDALGKLTWREPYVPAWVHFAWCSWCAENISDEELEAANVEE